MPDRNTIIEHWQFPLPASSLDRAWHEVLPKRTLRLCFDGESLEGAYFSCRVDFEDVAAFHCVYLPALTAELTNAYGRLIEVQKSGWLEELKTTLASWDTRKPSEKAWKHFQLCFDDGPAYDVLSKNFSIEVENRNGARAGG